MYVCILISYKFGKFPKNSNKDINLMALKKLRVHCMTGNDFKTSIKYTCSRQTHPQQTQTLTVDNAQVVKKFYKKCL